MNKLLLITIVLVVIFGTLIVLGNKKSNQPSTQSQQPTTSMQDKQNIASVSITLTDTGFTPKDITVKTETRVIWINKSGKNATVSSADHPTHRVYPRLNLGEFGDSSSVQLVFDEKGVYGYHNHYEAGENGTVTVE